MSSIVEEQRRIHALEQQRQEEARQEQPRQEESALSVEPRVEAPRAQAPRAEAPRVEAPRIDAREILDSAGLVMIETDRSKAPQAPQAQEDPVNLGRPRRERPKVEQEEELQQVETKR